MVNECEIAVNSFILEVYTGRYLTSRSLKWLVPDLHEVDLLPSGGYASESLQHTSYFLLMFSSLHDVFNVRDHNDML